MAKRAEYVKFFTTSRDKGIKGQQVIPDCPIWFAHNLSCLVYRFLGMYLEGANHRNIV